MKILTPDDKRAADIVREMEKRGYTLANVETNGAHDMSARQFAAVLRKEKSAKRWRRFWSFITFVLMLWLLIKIT